MADPAVERQMPSVLVVDDDREIRASLRKLLTEEGFDVVGEAADGPSAVALVRSHVPEVVMMDMRMPRLDGIDATQLIRAEHPEVQVVVFTAYGDEAIRREAQSMGVHSYLVKGCPPGVIFGALHRAAEVGRADDRSRWWLGSPEGR